MGDILFGLSETERLKSIEEAQKKRLEAENYVFDNPKRVADRAEVIRENLTNQKPALNPGPLYLYDIQEVILDLIRLGRGVIGFPVKKVFYKIGKNSETGEIVSLYFFVTEESASLFGMLPASIEESVQMLSHNSLYSILLRNTLILSSYGIDVAFKTGEVIKVQFAQGVSNAV